MNSHFKEWIGQVGNHIQAAKMSRLYRPKIHVYLEKSGYTVKTIETGAELNEVMKLRFQVFHKEYRKTQIPFGIDAEVFDLSADHLVIKDMKTNRIVGTYRLISSLWSSHFYSQSEFNISELLELPGEKLELSRACVHPDHRKGFVMHLLWRGLVQYIQKTDAKYLFGCSSIKTLNPDNVEALSSLFAEKNHVFKDIRVTPKENLSQQGSLFLIPETKVEEVEELVPPLLQSYLKAGAKVSRLPAYDFDFQCVDFFTVLELSSLTEMYEKRYRKC